MRTWLPGKLPGLRGGPVIAAAVLAAMGAAAWAGAAGAAPQPDVSQVRRQVNELTSQYDQASQQYDQVAQRLSAARATLSQVSREVAQNQVAFRALRGQVAQVAAASYEDSTMTSVAALLTSSDPRAVLGQASLLLELAGTRTQKVKRFLAAASQLTASQQQEQRTRDALAALENQKQQQKQHAAHLLASKKATLASLTSPQQQAVSAGGIGAGGTTTAVYTGPTSTQADKAVAFAYAQLGKPYRWGATGPGSYDCSGLAQAAWASAGVSIPRDTYQQWAALPHISASSLEPGDLLFYDAEGHVAMYAGNGEIIDAPQTGMDVQRIPMNSSWYAANFDGAARP
jgi:peptidoglycan DL-endopeptidase CwlO